MRVPLPPRRPGRAGPAATSSRPHWSARLEDRFNRLLGERLRAAGLRPRVEPYVGYGNPRQVRILARTLYSRIAPYPHARLSAPDRTVPDRTVPDRTVPDRTVPDRAGPIAHEPMRAVRGWRNFLTAAAVHCPLRVCVGETSFELESDRGGYLDVTLDVPLEPGWHEIRISTDGADPVPAPVLIVDDDTRVGIVSDIDDTVMVTALPRPLLAAWNAFVLHESARRVVPGMPVLFAELLHRHHDAPVIYLSTGAWNVAPALRRFLGAHGFPPGPLLLTDWGPTNTGLFRSGREHKERNLDQLVAMFPQIRWILIGDDGQHDPQTYGRLARRHPDHVQLIALRQLTAPEQVLAGHPGGRGHVAGGHVADGEGSVPQVHGVDGSVLRELLARLGLVDGPP